MEKGKGGGWKCSFPMARSVRLSVGWLDGRLVGRMVCHNFPKGNLLFNQSPKSAFPVPLSLVVGTYPFKSTSVIQNL